MAKYEILDDEGNVINRIKANRKFVEENFSGRFREITDKAVEAPGKSFETLVLEKLDAILDAVDKGA